MQKIYTHVIWDFNGTLLDDCQLAVNINCEMNKKRNKPEVSSDFYRDNFLHPPSEFYIRMGYTFEEEPYEAVSREFISEYACRQHQALLTAGVTEALEAFARAGLSQLVISAHLENLLTAHIKDLGIAENFTHLIGTSESVVSGKVERALQFASENAMDFSKAVFLGDTDHDLETAKALGCDCVLYSGGHQSGWRLRELGCPVYDTMAEIVAHVLQEK